MSPSPSSSSSSWDLALRNFSSQWFLVSQGTGVLSLVLRNLNHQFKGLGVISIIIWLYTCIIYLATLTFYLIRCYKYPKQVQSALRNDITETAALSSISITLSTIINMMCLVCVSAWGSPWGLIAYALTWINILMASVACIGIPYVFLKLEHPGVKNITPVVLLPFIAALTAAAGAGVISVFAKISPNLQIPLIIISFILIGMAAPLTLAYDALYLARLFDGYSMPPRMIYQTFVLCGPPGQTSFALQVLGTAATNSFGSYGKGAFIQGAAGSVVGTCCIFCALMIWGYGLFFWCYAILATIQALWGQDGGFRATKFSMSCWSVVFPWGVFTMSAIQFGKPTSLDSEAWAVWSTILAIVMFIIWLSFTVCTWRGIVTGELLGVRSWKARVVEDSDGLDTGPYPRWEE
ncbi:hypothetical protein TWF788_010635 [Orbilia oligospora]|uniref:Uncharacterized protein n=1 Tax=Orbilia oligospora TaxID=2813651 RepID=A0A7C8Q2V9_ORBOL|nr:hypothetical protein TWF788_010635 [Orbilia oligospora]